MKRAMYLVPVLFSLMFGLMPSKAHAKTETHGGAGITVDFPDSWKESKEDYGMLLQDAGGEIALLFMVIESDDMKKATEALDTQINKFVQDVKWEKEPEKQKINGMDAITLDGTGKAEGKAIDLGVMLLATPNHKFLMVLALAETAHKDAHMKELASILTSIRPTK